MPIEGHSSNDNQPFTFLNIFTSSVTYAYRNGSVKYSHLLDGTNNCLVTAAELTAFGDIWGMQLFKQLGLYFNKWT